MPAWMVMIGMQFLMFFISGISVYVWMKQPKDKMDIMLEELSKDQ